MDWDIWNSKNTYKTFFLVYTVYACSANSQSLLVPRVYLYLWNIQIENAPNIELGHTQSKSEEFHNAIIYVVSSNSICTYSCYNKNKLVYCKEKHYNLLLSFWLFSLWMEYLSHLFYYLSQKFAVETFNFHYKGILNI
jgi:hypothetical protein